MGKRRSSRNGAARQAGQGKHRKGKSGGTKPATSYGFCGLKDGRAPVSKAELRQLGRTTNAMTVAAYAFQLALDLKGSEGGGNPLECVNRAAMELKLSTDRVKDEAREIVRERLAEAKRGNGGE